MRRVLVLTLLLMGSLAASNFEQLMGTGTAAWREVRTDEDRANLAFFKALYEKEYEGKGGIPKRFHFIWLGPDLIPKASLERIKSWHKMHPDWTFYLWTDANQSSPFPFLVHRIVAAIDLTYTDKAYNAADTFKEKAFLLSLEILIREGGVVVEHDVHPLAPITPLHEGVDFFAGLNELKPPLFSSSVYISPYIIGAKSEHPFLIEAAGWYAEQGEKFSTYFAGNAPNERIRRTQVRLYEALRHGSMHLGKLRDRVYPAGEMERYVAHEKAGSWKRLETIREQKFRMKLEAISGKLPYILVLIITCVVLALTSIVLVWRKG